MSVRVRIAPSPTGNLHIGTARTALFNWLFAQKHGGQFLLRIEDTDLERSDKKFEQNIVDGLQWLGILWDGDITRQSERLDVYEKYLQQLLNSGKAFWCHHTIDELAEERERQSKSKEPQRHLCEHKQDARGKQKGQLIRLAVDWQSSRKIIFEDLIRGSIEMGEQLLGDLSLAKNLKTPLYNFAAVVDDLEMEISHVIRGEDHISNTPKQLLIYQALGKNPPQFAHIPLILNPDRSKLSKRHGATSVSDYKENYVPDALVNFMGFLGYTYTQEILSKEEMAKEFDLENVHKSGAVFDMKKLGWINSQYARRLTAQQLRDLTGLPIPDTAAGLIVERLERLSDAREFEYFWEMPQYDVALLVWKKSDAMHASATLQQTAQMLADINFENADDVRKHLDDLGVEVGDRGLVYWPLRAALSGKKASPDPVDIARVIGKEETLIRIDRAIKKLSE